MVTQAAVIPAPQISLPANISYGTVVYRALAILPDGADANLDPDAGVFSGITVTFQPGAGRLKDETANPTALTLFPQTWVCTLDGNGYLIGPNNQQGIRLPATDDPDVEPLNWKWVCTISGTSDDPAPFAFLLPAGGTVDLTKITPLPVADLGGVVTPPSSNITNLSINLTPTTVTVVPTGGGSSATIPAADSTSAGVMTSTQRDKLAGIATNATLNSSDTALRDRNTHTGTDPANSVPESALDVANAPITNGMFSHNGTRLVWLAAPSGGGGATSLTVAQTADAVTVTPSGGGTAATIPFVTSLLAGLLSPAQFNGLAPKNNPQLTGTTRMENIRVTAGTPASGKVLTGTDNLGNAAWADPPTGGGGGGATNLTVDRTATSVTINSDTGADASLPLATNSLAGAMSAADKTTISGLPTTLAAKADLVANGTGGFVVHPDELPHYTTDDIPEGQNAQYFTPARANLRADTRITARLGVDIQPYDTALANIAAATGSNGAFPMWTGAETITAFASTDTGRSLFSALNPAAARTTLGLATVASTGSFTNLTNVPTFLPGIESLTLAQINALTPASNYTGQVRRASNVAGNPLYWSSGTAWVRVTNGVGQLGGREIDYSVLATNKNLIDPAPALGTWNEIPEIDTLNIETPQDLAYVVNSNCAVVAVTGATTTRLRVVLRIVSTDNTKFLTAGEAEFNGTGAGGVTNVKGVSMFRRVPPLHPATAWKVQYQLNGSLTGISIVRIVGGTDFPTPAATNNQNDKPFEMQAMMVSG